MYLCFSEITQGTFCTPGEQTCKIISIHKIFKEHLTHLKAFHILGCKNLARNISRCFSWLTFPCVCVVSCSVVSDSLRPQGLQPPRLFYPWNSPGKNTGVGNHFLPQGIFPTHGLKPGLLCRRILYHLSHTREDLFHILILTEQFRVFKNFPYIFI